MMESKVIKQNCFYPFNYTQKKYKFAMLNVLFAWENNCELEINLLKNKQALWR